jgi:hypothetical protein
LVIPYPASVTGVAVIEEKGRDDAPFVRAAYSSTKFAFTFLKALRSESPVPSFGFVPVTIVWFAAERRAANASRRKNRMK